MRLDDDAYVNIDKLHTFLSRVNSSKPIYMGRPGFGRDAGDKIPPGDNYCMVMKDACKVLILTKMKRCFCNKAEQFQKFNFKFFLNLETCKAITQLKETN